MSYARGVHDAASERASLLSNELVWLNFSQKARFKPSIYPGNPRRAGMGLIARAYRRILWRLFSPIERFGVHLLPVHYYSPLPDTRELRANFHRFSDEHPMHGVQMNPSQQLDLMERQVKPFEQEYRAAGGEQFGLDAAKMVSFAPINALTLYAMIRSTGPRRMIEVGSGMSTRISAAAFERNRIQGQPGEFTVIEPYPDLELRAGLPGVARLIAKKEEDVPVDVFLELEEDDILFIDSSHTIKIFGDVNYLFLTVLPQLKPGVLVHVHDIFFPLDYLPHHFFNRFGKQIWQEQYLLHAFLMFNREFEVLNSASYLHVKYFDALRRLFPWYHVDRHPSSFWMRRVKRTSQ